MFGVTDKKTYLCKEKSKSIPNRSITIIEEEEWNEIYHFNQESLSKYRQQRKLCKDIDKKKVLERYNKQEVSRKDIDK